MFQKMLVKKYFDRSIIHLNYIIWTVNIADESETPTDVVNGVLQGITLFLRLSKPEHMKCHISPSCVWVFVGTAMQKPWLFRICCLFSQSLNALEKTLTVKDWQSEIYDTLSASFNSNWTVYIRAVSFLQSSPVYFKSWLLWAFVYTFPKVINWLCLTRCSYPKKHEYLTINIKWNCCFKRC